MEKIIGIVPSIRKKKFLSFSNENYTLVVTDKRSIFAYLTKDMLKEQVASAKSDAKASGMGFFGQLGAQLKASLAYAEKYRSMKPEDILKENEKNFEINNSSLEKVNFRFYEDQESARFYYDIIFKTGSEKFKFRTENDPKAELKKVYGSKLKTGLF